MSRVENKKRRKAATKKKKERRKAATKKKRKVKVRKVKTFLHVPRTLKIYDALWLRIAPTDQHAMRASMVQMCSALQTLSRSTKGLQLPSRPIKSAPLLTHVARS